MPNHHFRREPRARLWQRIASTIAPRPEGLDVALDDLDRWETSDRVHPRPLRQWRNRLEAAKSSAAARRELIALLEASAADTEPLMSCPHFAGPEFQPPQPTSR